MRVIPVASGKGGVGKSLAAANLAVAFAQAGKNVVLADLDLGASNLHLIIGHQKPGASIGAFLGNPKMDFETIIACTDIPNLRFIPGDAEIPGAANLKAAQRNILVRRLLAVKADILIADLGAGTHQSILDFFLMSGQGIIVSSPAVTATLNAYVFLKNAVFRLMYNAFRRGTPAYDYIEKLRGEGQGFKMLYLPKILEDIETRDPNSHRKFKASMDRFQPRLILNMLDSPSDAEVAMKIRRSCDAYLGLKVEHLGVIYRDSIQDISLASRLPILLYKPQSVLSQAIYRIADKILQLPEVPSPITFGSVDGSYQEAAMEAEIDFESKKEYIEELLHSGELSQGDLIETVKMQQLEINKVKKENIFLKSKLSKAIKEGYKP
ncbi:MAG: P-loop NTPase [Spirochaetaceae bacterium]|jgi:flagellar biosynthesis protein FlhG|nr:P-loop NTPase [Spirochaetaceae bacterium]